MTDSVFELKRLAERALSMKPRDRQTYHVGVMREALTPECVAALCEAAWAAMEETAAEDREEAESNDWWREKLIEAGEDRRKAVAALQAAFTQAKAETPEDTE